MGLGNTAKKVQRVSQLAEKLYDAVNEVLDRLSELHDRVEGAAADIEEVRQEQREQRAILEALADEQGVDVEAAVAEVEELAGDEGDAGEGATESDARTSEGTGDPETSADAG